jgi:hypothetical protein
MPVLKRLSSPATLAPRVNYLTLQEMAILLGQGKDITNYVKPFFSVDYYAKSYADAIIHPHNIDLVAPLELDQSSSDSDSAELSDNESDASDMLPPSTRHPRGRPSKYCI